MTIIEELQHAISQTINAYLDKKKGYIFLNKSEQIQVDTVLSLIDLKKNPEINEDAQLLREALKTVYEKHLKPNVFGLMFNSKGFHSVILKLLNAPEFQENIINVRERIQLKNTNWYIKLEQLQSELEKKSSDAELNIKRVEQLQLTCQRFQGKYQKLLDKNKLLEGQLKALQEKLNLLSNESALYKKFEALEEKVNSQESSIKSLIEENAKLREEKEKLEQELEFYKQRYESLLHRYNAMEDVAESRSCSSRFFSQTPNTPQSSFSNLSRSLNLDENDVVVLSTIRNYSELKQKL